MASGKHAIELPVSIEEVWTYISDIDRWASTVPGYVSHEIVNDKQSRWVIKGDLGLMKKTAKLEVEITDWIEPTKVEFHFKSLSEDFFGNGYYEAVALDDHHTRISGNLVIESESTKGPMATMQNTILKKFVPRITREITTAVADRFKSLN